MLSFFSLKIAMRKKIMEPSYTVFCMVKVSAFELQMILEEN